MNKAALVTGALLTLLSAPSALGAVIFGGGTAGNPVTVTITEDIVIPLGRSATLTQFAFVFKDVYDSPQSRTVDYPETSHGAVGAIRATVNNGSGSSFDSISYLNWGAWNLTVQDLGSRDLYGFFGFSSAISVSSGATLTLHAGTTTLNPLVVLPDNPVSEVISIDGSGASMGSASIPEPSAMVLSFALGGAALLRRRRAA